MIKKDIISFIKAWLSTKLLIYLSAYYGGIGSRYQEYSTKDFFSLNLSFFFDDLSLTFNE